MQIFCAVFKSKIIALLITAFFLGYIAEKDSINCNRELNVLLPQRYFLLCRRVKQEIILKFFGNALIASYRELPSISIFRTSSMFSDLAAQLSETREEADIRRVLEGSAMRFSKEVADRLWRDLEIFLERFKPDFDLFSPLWFLGDIADFGRLSPDRQRQIQEERKAVEQALQALGYHTRLIKEDWPRGYYILLSGESFFGERVLDDMVREIGSHLTYSEQERFVVISVGQGGLDAQSIEAISAKLDGRMRIYELPCPRINREGASNHLDMYLNIFEGGKVILADPDYYQQNKDSIDSIAREQGYKIVVVPEEEKHLYPSNFLSLFDGRILMTSAPQTYAEIVRTVGPREAGELIIMIDSALEENLNLGGGIKCMMTYTYPLIDILQSMGYGYDEVSALISVLSTEQKDISVDKYGRMIVTEATARFFALESLYRFILRTEIAPRTKYLALRWIAEEFSRLGKHSSAELASERAESIGSKIVIPR